MKKKQKQINDIWNIMLKRHYVSPAGTSFFLQVQEKLKACRSSKLNFSSSCFTADGRDIKI